MNNILYVNLEARDHLGEWLNNHGLTGSIAEIGVMSGGFARTILNKWNGQTYYMVDFWGKQDATVYKERTEDVDYERCYNECLDMSTKDSRIKILRNYSVESAKLIPDESLDCVFIDANHAYEPVMEDLKAWWPKVKPGGVFSGHDYGNDTNWPHWCEVKRAVDTWMSENKQTFVYTRCDSWWCIKR